MFDKGIFGGLFDLNGDGKLDSFEQAADFAFFAALVDEDAQLKIPQAKTMNRTIMICRLRRRAKIGILY